MTELRHVQKFPAGVRTPRLGATVLSGTLALNLLALAMPLIMLQIFDRVIPYEAHVTLSVFLVCLMVVTIAELVFRVCRIAIIGHDGTRFEADLADAAFCRMLQTVSGAHERDGLGVHFERFGAVAQLREHYAGQGRLLIVDLPFTGIFIAMIALIGGWLAVVPLGILAVVLCTAVLMKRRQSAALDLRKTVDGRRYSFLIEFLSQIATVKSNRMEAQMLRRYEMLTRQSVSASRAIVSLSSLSQSLAAVLGQGAVAAMGLCGAWFVVQGAIGVGELAACMLLNGRVTQPLLKLLGIMMQGESVAQARNRLAELGAMPVRPVPRQDLALTGAISLRNLGFRHPRSGKILFEGVTADIAPGECLSISGADGGGRTSLMRMILAEQPPSMGVLRIDGAPPVLHLRHRGPGGIGFLDQSPHVFSGTVLENITVFGMVRDREMVLQLCEKLGLEAEVRALPLGYQTRLGPEGGPRSPGFLQRVCLARALALEPRILLFNHATSGMDDACVERAATVLSEQSGKTTLLLATTQPRIRRLASRSLVLAPSTTAAAWDEDRMRDLAAARRLQDLTA